MQDNKYYKELVPKFGKIVNEKGREKAAEIWANTPDLYTLCASLSEELGLGPFDENEKIQAQEAFQKDKPIKTEPIKLSEEWDKNSPYGRVKEKEEEYLHSSTSNDLSSSGLYPHNPDILKKVNDDLKTHPSTESYNGKTEVENGDFSNSYKRMLTNPSIPSGHDTEYTRNTNWPDAKTVAPGEINYNEETRAL